MKNNKIVSEIKTAGVALVASATMFSCGNKQLSESQMQAVHHKADSAVAVYPEYRVASNLFDLCELKIQKYRDANKQLIKAHARNYIKNNITDIALAKFMLESLGNDKLLFALDTDSCENEGVSVEQLITMRSVRRNQRWFNDMILYLSDKYNEKQLLNSEFFTVVNNSGLKSAFERNTQQIEMLQSNAEFAAGRKKDIYDGFLQQYTESAKKQR